MHADPDSAGGDSYFATMTDMMVGLLFIFLIMVAFFAYKLSRQVQSEEAIPLSMHEVVVDERDTLRAELAQIRSRQLATFNESSRDTRRRLLTAVQAEVERKTDLKLLVDAERGVLRLQGVDLFASSSTRLSNPADVGVLATALRDQLRCAIYDAPERATCDGSTGFVETVYIEGHTDSVPLRGGRRDLIASNLQLSARRASNTFETMVRAAPALLAFSNPAGQPILSVAGFGAQRPIADNTTPEGRANNRRIDIRVEMYAPRDESELTRLRTELTAPVPSASDTSTDATNTDATPPLNDITDAPDVQPAEEDALLPMPSFKPQRVDSS